MNEGLKKFIERNLDVPLFDWQERIIEAVTTGEQTRAIMHMPRNHGRSELQRQVDAYLHEARLKRIKHGCPNCGKPWSQKAIAEDLPLLGSSCFKCLGDED